MIKIMDTVVTRRQFQAGNNLWHFAWVLILSFQLAGAQADALKLQSVDFTTLSGDNLQVQLTLSGPAFSPRVFHTDNPARIALDLPGVANSLDKKPIPINVGNAETIQAIAASDRTRVVINLTELPPYSTRVEGNNIFVTLSKSKGALPPAPMAQPVASVRAPATPLANGYPTSGQGIRNIDFRRGDKGVGRILITLASPRTVADIREEGRKVIATFPNASLPPTLARRLDVMDFATPVQTIDSMEDASGAKLVITPATDEFDYSSYQLENLLTIEFRPLSKVEREEIKRKAFSYSGEKLSLNFQDIPVRSVLQILGDFTNLNIVASDTVGGNVTLRLNEVPWDQALDLVLKAKHLGKRQEGNIIQIMPLDELNKQTKEQLEAEKVVEELEPLKTEIIQLNYATAEDIKAVLTGESEDKATTETTSTPILGGGLATTKEQTTSNADRGKSLLTDRASVTIDPRTNQLIVKETAQNLERIRELLKLLDVPVRQVLIESRIVIANNDFSRELGSKFSVNSNPRKQTIDGDNGPFTRLIRSNGFMANGDALSDLGAGTAIAGPGGAIGFTVLKIGSYMLDLELSAAQREGRGEIVSNPRVLTADQAKAVIKQGVQIPFQATVALGGGSVNTITFKDAFLELNVTPHITPDDNIRMELIVKKDSKGEAVGSNFAIDKREIDTEALVSNGDTVVLGGVYEGTKSNSVDKVPFLGDLPGIGFLFRRNQLVDQKKELLIFITPKIIKQELGQR